MKILIVHHGAPKSAGGPATGSALRAQQLSLGLSSAGHTVKTVTRASDCDNGFVDSQDLLRRAKAFDPDAMICVQMEEAKTLSILEIPLAIDLYAMRLLEAPFSGNLDETVLACLGALACGDIFLVSAQRQKWAWLGVLSMAGVDISNDPTLHIPLCTTLLQSQTKNPEFTMVGGGQWWPWQNPWDEMKKLLSAMDTLDFGQIHWYGSGDKPPPYKHPRLHLKGWLGHDEFVRELSRCHVAFDAYSLHPERELAVSFRQMDYLSAGLPIACQPGGPLEAEFKTAGWIVKDWAKLINRFKNNPDEIKRKAQAVKRLATKWNVANTTKPLLSWAKNAKRKKRKPSTLLTIGLQHLETIKTSAQNKRLSVMVKDLQEDIEKKNSEAIRSQTQIDHLTAAIDRLSRAVDEVAGFKREATTILGSRIQSHADKSENLSRENAILRADIEKKSAELESMDNLRQRLENDLQNLREELHRSRRQKKSFFKAK